MKKTFRLIARDETYAWGGNLPKEIITVYSVYLFVEGEATFCCSLTPSTWSEFVNNEFIGLDVEHPFVEANTYDDGGEEGSYLPFVDVDKSARFVSEPRTFETDEEDKDEAERDLWEQANESFRANVPMIPCLGFTVP